MEDFEQLKARLLKELVDLEPSGDPESAHGRADDILCELLTALGHADVVKAFTEVPRWYA